MHYDFSLTKKFLTECATYSESINNTFLAAEVYVNLGTEIMFNQMEDHKTAYIYLNQAIRIFEDEPNQHLSYAQNNLAIYQILYNNDMEDAEDLLERSLLVGISDFTYMTILLNLAMCRLKKLGGNSPEFQDTYNKFIVYYSQIKLRKQATQYEDIYKTLLDIIVIEDAGNMEMAYLEAKSLQSELLPTVL